MNPTVSKFLLDLVGTTMLAFGLFFTFCTIAIVCASIHSLFRTTFFGKHFASQWKQCALIAICMAVMGIIYGINHARQTVENEPSPVGIWSALQRAAR